MFLDPPPTSVAVLTSAGTRDLYNLFPVKSASIELYTLHYSTDRYTQGGHEFVAVIGTREMGCVWPANCTKCSSDLRKRP